MKWLLLITTFCFTTNAFADVHDRFVVDGNIRSEYDPGKGTGSDWLSLWYANNGLHGDEGCLFDADDSFNACPGGRIDYLGASQRRAACGGNTTLIGDSWLGCLSYSDSPFSLIGNNDDEYWVIHANHDPAFEQCRQGPPSLSHPITNHAIDPDTLYNVSATPIPGLNRKEINIRINADELDPFCDGELAPDIPFLSVGSHLGAGNPNFVATLNSGTTAPIRDKLKFSMKLTDYSPFDCDVTGCPAAAVAGSHAGFFVIAEWSSPANPGDPAINYPKFVWIELFGSGVLSGATNFDGTSKWNWPIFDSFLWPGGEIAFLGANTVSQCGGINISPLHPFGYYTNYNIDLTELFRCASDTFNSFQTPMPMTGNVNVLGVHFFTEVANATTGELEVSVRDVRIDYN